jgi:hypothetical protein
VLGAVYRPLARIVPPVAVQVTAVFVLPVTLAVNCCVPPVISEAEVGEIETATAVGVDPLGPVTWVAFIEVAHDPLPQAWIVSPTLGTYPVGEKTVDVFV